METEIASNSRLILILVQTLRIGGIERNTLDQAYKLRDLNEQVIILVLDRVGTSKNANFIEQEKFLIDTKGVDIRYCRPGIYGQMISIIKILKFEKIDFVIDNTLSGTLKLRFLSLLIRKKLKINTVVQQFLSLSAPIQRYKRLFYAQFCTNLIINSINYAIDWDFYRNKNPLTRILFRKKFKIIRNGVYIPRLPLNKSIYEIKKNRDFRFLFLGRLKSWKGIDRLKEIDRVTNHQMNFLILTSEYDASVVSEFNSIFGKRIEFIFGKTLQSYLPKVGDIHIYPVDYGFSARAIEAISTNCLEMAQIGIPSLVTRGGTDNWPELVRLGIVIEVDWEDTDQLYKALQKCEATNLSESTLNEISKLIDIKNNLIAHRKYNISF